MKKLFLFFLLLLFLHTGTYVVYAENLSNSPTATQKVPSALFGSNKNLCTINNSTQTITCTQRLFMGTCELFELGIASSDELKKYACAAYPDPLPADAVTNTPNTFCIIVNRTKQEGLEMKYLTVEEARKESYKYCDAIAIKTGGSFDLLFNFISYIFFIVQPLLISVAVVYIIIIGLQIMYAGGSPEDVQKKIKEKLINVLSGLTLLFLIKLILVTINGAFFVN